jgi:hypothetical protein
MQQKDVIYIDVEDDITAIISKVKSSKQKIVALVPPKRINVLQSAVNLRLLARAADNADKRLVLITGNAALAGLAANAKIPVAKNLQSRPELADTAEKGTDDEDVIDGGELPIGEHAKAASSDADEEIIIPPASIKGLDIDGESAPVKRASADEKSKSKKGIKVPDFGSFRKRMALGAVAGVLLIGFLVWAIVFAPRATVVVSARTNEQSINVPVTLNPGAETDIEKATIKSVSKQDKVVQTVDFDATGSKDVGEKAKGTVRFTSDSFSALMQGITIPAGTVVQSSNGSRFTTDRTVQLSISAGNSDSTGVTAAENGESYNGISGDVSGGPSSVDASFTGSTSGGTTKVVKVVQQSDVEKAKQQIADQDTNEIKEKLKDQFGSDIKIIDSSFTVNGAEAQSSPAINAEAPTGKAKLSREMTYTMTGVAKAQLDTFLDDSLQGALTNKSEQRIYDNGQSTVKFADFKPGENGTGTVMVNATGQIGPKINDEAIKDQVKGKRTGEIIGDLKAIDGVSDVTVDLSPFWVTGVPGDVNKISIEFKLIKNDE